MRAYILSSIVSLRGSPKVSVRQHVKIQAIMPKIAGGNQEFMFTEPAMVLTKGEIALPTIPTTLVHPKPILLTSVG
jgi:hypothetical protein